MNDNDLLQRETDAGSDTYHGGNPSPAQQANIDQLEAHLRDSDNFYTGTGDQQIEGQASSRKKKGLIGTLIALTAVGGIGGFGIIQGPLQIIQLSKLLSSTFFSRNDESSDSSTRRLYNTITGNRENSNLSLIAGKLAKTQRAKLLDMGIEANFDTPDGKGRAKIQSLKIDPNTEAGKSMLSRAASEGANISNLDPDGRVNINVRGNDGGKIARSLTDHMTDLSGKKGIAGLMAKRRLKKLFGVNFHPKNVSKRATETFNDYVKRRRGERATEVKEGRSTRAGNSANGGTDEEGNPIEPDPEVQEGSNNGRGTVDDVTKEPDPVKRKTKLQQLRKSPLVKWGAAGAAVASITCAVKDVGNNVEQYQMDNVIKPLIRLLVMIVAGGSQTQAMQDMDMNEARVEAEPLHDPETDTTVWGSAPLMAAAGKTGGTDIDPAVKSQIVGAYSGEKAPLFAAIDSVPGIGALCGVNDFVGNLPIVKQVGEASNAVLGGLASVATGKSIDEWMAELVAVLAGDAVDVLSRGASLGGLLGYAGLITANGEAIPSGGVGLTPKEGYEWRQYLDEQKIAEMKTKPLSERLFDVTSPDSVVGGLFMHTAPYTSNMQSLSNIARINPVSFVSDMFGSFSSMFMSRAAAQTVHGYDYGIPEFGKPLSQLNSERYENPHDNIDRLEDNDFAKLKEANKNWGKCFGNPLDDAGNIVDKEVENYKEINDDECKNAYGNQDFQDYQMYIQDAVTIRSLACYEGIDEASCDQIGMGAQTASSTAPASGDSTAPPVGNTAATPCAAGTTDLDETDGYSEGNKYRIRLCGIPGFSSTGEEDVAAGGVIRVNSTVSGKWLQLFQNAKAAGITLSGSSSFRSMAKQQYLYNCYQTGSCNNGNEAAVPGTSNHQIGYAVDIDIVAGGKDPTLTTCKANPDAYPTYKWLTANAPGLGIQGKVNSECWHWSVGGS